MEGLNRSQLRYDDFKKAVKQGVLANENLSYFVRQLVENNSIDLREVSNYYWVKDAVKVFEYLDEYLKHNIDNLDTYELASKFYLDGMKYCKKEDPVKAYYYNNHPVIQVCYYDSVLSSGQYNMYTDGYPGELHYVLKKGISYCELLEKEGVLGIHFTPDDKSGLGRLSIEKEYINNGLFIEEEYAENWQDGYVRTRIYDLNNALERYKTDPFDGTPTKDTVLYPLPIQRERNGIMGARKPWIINDDDCIFSSTFYYQREDQDEYKVEYCDDKGGHCETMNGDSLYSTYYNFMVEKGYFNGERKTYERNK